MFTILIAGYGQIGRPDLSKEVFTEMLSKGLKPDPAAVHALGKAYFDVGQEEGARRAMLGNWPGRRTPGRLKGLSVKTLFWTLKKLGREQSAKGGTGRGRGRELALGVAWKIVKLWKGGEKGVGLVPVDKIVRRKVGGT